MSVGPLLEMRLRSQEVFAQMRRMEEQAHWIGKNLIHHNAIFQHPSCDGLTPKEASKDKNVTKPRKKSKMNQFGNTDMGRSLRCQRSQKPQQQFLPEDRAKQTRSGYVMYL